MEITELLSDAIEELRTMLDTESVVGEPIFSDDHVTVIPVTKMSLGFASAGGEIAGKNIKIENGLPLGGIGGGANIMPLGFLVIEGDEVRFMSIEGGTGKWEKYLENIFELFAK